MKTTISKMDWYTCHVTADNEMRINKQGKPMAQNTSFFPLPQRKNKNKKPKKKTNAVRYWTIP